MASDTDFHSPSSRGKALSLSDFEGKVPVALVFLGPLDEAGDQLADLDHHQVEFGKKRVQLLAVAQADGADVRAIPFSGFDLPVLADPHRELLGRFGDGEADRGFAVLLDKQGQLAERLPFSTASDLLERTIAVTG